MAKTVAAVDKFFWPSSETLLQLEKERSRMDRLERERCIAEESFAKGWKKGFEEGLEESRKKGREALIATLLNQCSAARVAELVDLPLSYIEAIARRHGL